MKRLLRRASNDPVLDALLSNKSQIIDALGTKLLNDSIGKNFSSYYDDYVGSGEFLNDVESIIRMEIPDNNKAVEKLVDEIQDSVCEKGMNH